MTSLIFILLVPLLILGLLLFLNKSEEAIEIKSVIKDIARNITEMIGNLINLFKLIYSFIKKSFNQGDKDSNERIINEEINVEAASIKENIPDKQKKSDGEEVTESADETDLNTQESLSDVKSKIAESHNSDKAISNSSEKKNVVTGLEATEVDSCNITDNNSYEDLKKEDTSTTIDTDVEDPIEKSVYAPIDEKSSNSSTPDSTDYQPKVEDIKSDI